MARKTFFPNPDNKPVGYSPATRVGDAVFASGHVSVDAAGNVVGEGDAGAQSEQAFSNVEAALKAAGATMDDVTKITCFLVDVADYDAYAAVRLRLFPENGPASSTVVVKELVKPEYLVEIEAIAVVG
ncbi:MAG: RidA family protein [Chloroflexi bacterium]|nr:RidA family protein [Chloroflexota bacterium]